MVWNFNIDHVSVIAHNMKTIICESVSVRTLYPGHFAYHFIMPRLVKTRLRFSWEQRQGKMMGA